MEVVIENAASKLRVERRRIYDIVNILESVQLVDRKAKNKYVLNGKYQMSHCLEILRLQYQVCRINFPLERGATLNQLSKDFIGLFLISQADFFFLSFRRRSGHLKKSRFCF